MEITIKDDFNLNRIVRSGQCFRTREFTDGTFRFVTGSHILYIKEVATQQYEVSCDKNEWQNVWWDYFDFGRNYQSIPNNIPSADSYMKIAAFEGKGIRILRQDSWEMLITFIISQRKSIPAIRSSIELLCNAYGSPVQTDRETLWLFPSAEQLHRASDFNLQNCKLGYRIGYIKDAIATVYEQKIDLYDIGHYDDIALFTELKSIKGVGDKVASCICLFSYGRTAMAPIDTWISKIIDSKYNGINPFPAYGEFAGIMQQYAFFYAQNHKKEV